MNTKICGKCKKEKPLTEFYPHKRDGFRSRCKDCHKDDLKEYRSTEGYLSYMRKYLKMPKARAHDRDWRKEYRKRPYVRIKTYAQTYVNHAIQSGRINREPCSVCGVKQAEAHHSDYNEPLLIVWLCADCHRELHKAIKRTIEEAK